MALETLREDNTISAIASRHGVHPNHPNQVSSWKKKATDGMTEIFSVGRSRRRDHEEEILIHTHTGGP